MLAWYPAIGAKHWVPGINVIWQPLTRQSTVVGDCRASMVAAGGRRKCDGIGGNGGGDRVSDGPPQVHGSPG